MQSSLSSPKDSVTFKLSVLGCCSLFLIGWLIFTVSGLQYLSKEEAQKDVKPGDSKQDLVIPQKQSEAPVIITKKPDKPIVVEEGSEAYYCIQNNGGDGCLSRDRFAPNYQVVDRRRTYEDRLVEYGIRPINNNCPPEIAWQPNCQY